ncbi:TonB-dependent receptor plug domain-containing protein [Sphingobium chungbukense]|uniref:TonB-dependent receptor n=1 Tax=Sphingobium chungbukense TaxID=56193 RepID=A0A0M3AM02_9SPHN|nr:TonB-dependent receptor [Sphingobium chungbukense]KKW91162.1 TonB-dependent receptor [Sphingobium chungbukense]
MSENGKFLPWRAGAAPVALIVALAGGSALAQAQDDASQPVDNVIIVTGSHIARPELDVANPIVAVTAAQIEQTGRTNIVDILLRNPALTASTGSSLAGGADAAFGETGVNLLNLRNLGTQRTLVLVNGKRHVAGIANSAAVDINSIPQDLIERVDVLTGGASAIYGADGVSGVVNFVLKRNFEGLAARAQSGISSKGDAANRYFSITAGRNFADGRGNFAVSYEYNKADRLSSFARDFTGNPARYRQILQNQDDLNDDPNVPDRIPYANLTWADSSPDGAVDVDFDEIPDFTGSGLPYDRGLVLEGSNGRAVGGSNTPVAGYYGDLQPSTRRHVVNALTSYEFSPALRFYAEGKYAATRAYSVSQPSFDFFTYLQPDNAYLIDRFGAGTAPYGALVTRDNFDFGIRGETVKRETKRIVLGFDGEISDHLRYDISYVYGETKVRYRQTANLIGDRYFAALDAVRDPATGNIVCRSTLEYDGVIDPINFDGPATTFTPGTGSACRPLNILGNGVADPAALAFVLADNLSRSKISQEVVSGSVSGDLDSAFTFPGGGSFGFALGGEYRREKSRDTPDLLIQNGDFRDFEAIAPSSGRFSVKEFFAEVNAPILSHMRLAELLSLSGAVRFSDYTTIGKTTTWKLDGIYAPIPDIRFRGSYSQAVRAPNIGELFQPVSGTFSFVDDPCDVRRLNEGTQYRQANCTTILSGLGLSPSQIAGFSPAGITNLRGLASGNPNLTEETAKTWTAGVVLQPRFIRGLTLSFDWYDIKIKNAVRTPSVTELAGLCVDQPTIDNVFCQNIFRGSDGEVLGSNVGEVGFRVQPANVAAIRTAGADFTITYNFTPGDFGSFNIALVGGYLAKKTEIATPGADLDNDILEGPGLGDGFNPRWRGTLDLTWKLKGLTANYSFNYFSKTRRYTTEQLAANPDLVDPQYVWYKSLKQHDARLAYDVGDKFQFYVGVNNFTDQKPDLGELSYPISGVGRFWYAGVKLNSGKLF